MTRGTVAKEYRYVYHQPMGVKRRWILSAWLLVAAMGFGLVLTVPFFYKSNDADHFCSTTYRGLPESAQEYRGHPQSSQVWPESLSAAAHSGFPASTIQCFYAVKDGSAVIKVTHHYPVATAGTWLATGSGLLLTVFLLSKLVGHVESKKSQNEMDCHCGTSKETNK